MDQSCQNQLIPQITPDEDTLSAALHVLAGDVCLRIAPADINVCKPLIIPTSSSRICPETLSTWLCDGAHFFTLFRSKGVPGTLLFSHSNEVLYHASVDAQISLNCPEGIAFLCQFTTDSLPEGGVPRLLAFDVLCNQGQSPSDRGDTLREMQIHLPQPLCIVQWIGPRQYISNDFIAGLPHRIRGVFAIGATPLAADALEQ
jgi:hypothetical protein